MKRLKLVSQKTRSTRWDSLLTQIRDIKQDSTDPVKIAMVGKYTGLQDSYLSVIKALEYAAINAGRELKILWIESNDLIDKDSVRWETLQDADGILVPGGFGGRGTKGKMKAIRYARENNIPFLGICLGMQLAVVEFCKNVLEIADIGHEEFHENAQSKAIVFMPEISKTMKGGTMRLGSRHTYIKDPDSLAAKVYYGASSVYERHRHRYEVNIEYKKRIEEKGMIFSGEDGNKERMEIIELENHPFFLGTQYHPEFTSRPFQPNPAFYSFMLASSGQFDKIGKRSDLEMEYTL